MLPSADLKQLGFVALILAIILAIGLLAGGGDHDRTAPQAPVVSPGAF